MDDRGLFNGRGFWALALLWLPAGVVAQALVRFLPETGPQAGAGLSAAMLPLLAGSLVLVAPCGLPLALGCRRVWRLGYRRGAWLGLDRAGSGHRGGVGGGRAARTDRDRRLCSGSKRADMGRVVVAGAPRLTADGGPAAQQGAGRVSGYGREVAVALAGAVVNGPWTGWRRRSSGRQRSRRVARNDAGTACSGGFRDGDAQFAAGDRVRMTMSMSRRSVVRRQSRRSSVPPPSAGCAARAVQGIGMDHLPAVRRSGTTVGVAMPRLAFIRKACRTWTAPCRRGDGWRLNARHRRPDRPPRRAWIAPRARSRHRGPVQGGG